MPSLSTEIRFGPYAYSVFGFLALCAVVTMVGGYIVPDLRL